MTTMITPTIVNHLKPSFFKSISNLSPNFIDKYDTIKNLKPLEMRLIITNK